MFALTSVAAALTTMVALGQASATPTVAAASHVAEIRSDAVTWKSHIMLSQSAARPLRIALCAPMPAGARIGSPNGVQPVMHGDEIAAIDVPQWMAETGEIWFETHATVDTSQAGLQLRPPIPAEGGLQVIDIDLPGGHVELPSYSESRGHLGLYCPEHLTRAERHAWDKHLGFGGHHAPHTTLYLRNPTPNTCVVQARVVHVETQRRRALFVTFGLFALVAVVAALGLKRLSRAASVEEARRVIDEHDAWRSVRAK